MATRSSKRSKRGAVAAAAVVAASPPTASLVLKVVTNPESEFFKDEGGKSNHLTCTILLAKGSAAPAAMGDEKYVVGVKLYFESGVEVTDASECLSVHGNPFEKRTISLLSPSYTVSFRLEKVSRRQDGQRFKLRFTLQDSEGAAIDGVEPVDSGCVNVLSKRKPAARRGKDGSSSGRKQASGTKRSRDGGALGSAAEARIMRRMDEMQQLLMTRIAMMQQHLLIAMQHGGVSAAGGLSSLSGVSAPVGVGAKQAGVGVGVGGNDAFNNFATLALLDASQKAQMGGAQMGPPSGRAGVLSGGTIDLHSRVPNLRLISRDAAIIDPTNFGFTPRGVQSLNGGLSASGGVPSSSTSMNVAGLARAPMQDHTLRLSSTTGIGGVGAVTMQWKQSPRASNAVDSATASATNAAAAVHFAVGAAEVRAKAKAS